MKTKIVLLALLVLASFCHAQEELPTIVPDRPGITFGTEVMPLHKLGWDNGFCYERLPDGSPSITLNSTIFRYGIFENVELRLGTDFLLFNDLSPAIGIAPLTFGVKTSLFEGTEILPSVGVLAELQSPHIGTKELLPSHLAPSLYLLFEHAWDNGLWLCYNVGEEWDGDTPEPTTMLGIVLGYGLTDEVGIYCDFYNYLHSEGNQHLTELGATWLVNRRLQLDLEVTLDLQNLKDYVGIGCGVSWMIN